MDEPIKDEVLVIVEPPTCDTCYYWRVPRGAVSNLYKYCFVKNDFKKTTGDGWCGEWASKEPPHVTHKSMLANSRIQADKNHKSNAIYTAYWGRDGEFSVKGPLFPNGIAGDRATSKEIGDGVDQVLKLFNDWSTLFPCDKVTQEGLEKVNAILAKRSRAVTKFAMAGEHDKARAVISGTLDEELDEILGEVADHEVHKETTQDSAEEKEG